MSATVAVITDSAASLPPALARKWGIEVVPLHVVVDGVSTPEGDGISPDQVLAALTSGATVGTSQPGAEAFRAAYQRAADAGATAVVAVLISSTLSGTVDTARRAGDGAAIPVRVVDTLTVAMATGYAAIAAAAVARAGGSIDEVSDEAQRVARSSTCLFTVDTLDYLRKGGRISPTVAAIGKVLGVRPVLQIQDGQVVAVERVRSTARARAALLARIDAAVATLKSPGVAIMVLSEPEVGDDAARALERRHDNVSMVVRTPVSAVLSAHAGPGTLAAVTADLPAGLV